MKYEVIKNKIENTNSRLSLRNAPQRIGIMSQHNGTRLTLYIGTPEQIAKDTGAKSVLYYATRTETAAYLDGINTGLDMSK